MIRESPIRSLHNIVRLKNHVLAISSTRFTLYVLRSICIILLYPHILYLFSRPNQIKIPYRMSLSTDRQPLELKRIMQLQRRIPDGFSRDTRQRKTWKQPSTQTILCRGLGSVISIQLNHLLSAIFIFLSRVMG